MAPGHKFRLQESPKNTLSTLVRTRSSGPFSLNATPPKVTGQVVDKLVELVKSVGSSEAQPDRLRETATSGAEGLSWKEMFFLVPAGRTTKIKVPEKSRERYVVVNHVTVVDLAKIMHF